MSFFKATATIASYTMLSRVFGFVRDVVSARLLGASIIGDAFVVALRFPNFFRRMTAEGAFSVSFVPLYTRTLKEEGEEAATNFANQALAWMLAILIPITIVVIIAMPIIIPLITPGFKNDIVRFELGVLFSRITFVYLMFMSLAALMGGMLNARNVFGPFAAAPVVFNICQIAAMWVQYLHPGIFGWHTTGHALAWAVALSGALQVVWLWWSLKTIGIKLRMLRPKLSQKIRNLGKLMAPGLIGASAMQINVLIDQSLASLLPKGSITVIYYADRLQQLPLGIIGVAVGTALLPQLAKKIADHSILEANKLFNSALFFSLLVTLPCATALTVLAEPIVRTLFEGGAFDYKASVITAQTLMCYAIGLPAYVAIKVYATGLYAQENTKTPVKMTLVFAAINTALALILIKPLAHMGIALATSIAGWGQVLVYMHLVKQQHMLQTTDQTRHQLAWVVVACGVMAVGMAGALYVLAPWFAHGGLLRFLALALAGGVGVVLFAGLLYVAKVFKPRALWQMMRAGELE